MAVGAPPAFAATISVNTVVDELNADGDCSLREALAGLTSAQAATLKDLADAL
jgi:CSLREA domain-containing protein